MWSQNKDRILAETMKEPKNGLPSPISCAKARQGDIESTIALEEALKRLHIYEEEHVTLSRQEIVTKLNTLVNEWVKKVSLKKVWVPDIIQKCRGKVYLYGSHGLGLHTKGADLDVLCVGPKHIPRREFFTSFYGLLQQQSDITELRAVEGAFVPVIKMKFNGIDIDMVYAKLALKEVSDNTDLMSDHFLTYLEESCVRSLNGYRNTVAISSLVPNIDNFKLTLQAIKLWAKQREIYSNVLGFLGGISWAILVARICQLYPHAVPATLVQKFFFVYSQWDWRFPIRLREATNTNLQFPVWNPRINNKDKHDLMPIITPAYPEQNTTFNMTASTRKIIIEEFKNGHRLMDEILTAKSTWDELFKRSQFFNKYRHFTVLLVSANSADDQCKWRGLVQSRIRLLIGALERNPSINLAHINPKYFQHREDTPEKGKFCSMWFIGLEVQKTENGNIDITPEIERFVNTVNNHAATNKTLKGGMKLEIRSVKRKDLTLYVQPDVVELPPIRKKHKADSALEDLTNKKMKI